MTRHWISICDIHGGRSGTLEQVFLLILFSAANHHSTFTHRPVRCAIALTKQHAIIPSVLC
jgi:hypothetical protein